MRIRYGINRTIVIWFRFALGGGVAHSVLIWRWSWRWVSCWSKVKVAGIVALGVTGILFVGIAFSYFGMNVDEHLMHFLKEFGLILFVYSIGLQVGPGFFSSFRKGGVTLNKLAVLVVALGVVMTVALYYITGLVHDDDGRRDVGRRDQHARTGAPHSRLSATCTPEPMPRTSPRGTPWPTRWASWGPS